MLQSIHHITYLVWDLDSVEDYFRQHFGLEPTHSENVGRGKARSSSYQIGPTLLRFSQPGRPASMEYEYLRRFGGPVVSHIGLTVDNLAKRSQELKESGVDFTQPEITVSPHGGYELIDIAPEGSCGKRSQNELFSLNHMFPDSELGIRLQLCQSISPTEGDSDA
jgi:catechol 2,3-dioxygenase-like lactoylglutathione lyase family enzyme